MESFCRYLSTKIRAPNEPTFFGPDGKPDILDIAIVRNICLIEDPVVLNELTFDHNPIILKIDPEAPYHEEYIVRKNTGRPFATT